MPSAAGAVIGSHVRPVVALARERDSPRVRMHAAHAASSPRGALWQVASSVTGLCRV